MGCPPDPVEVSIAYSAERIVALGEKYNRLVGEYAQAAKLAAELFTDFQRIAGHEVTQVFHSRTDVSPSEYEPYADATAQFALEAQYRGRVKELETALCELRTRFCVLLQQRDKSYSETTRAALGRERHLHLLHREEDREQWLAWLKKHRAHIEYELTEGARDAPGRVDMPALRQLAERIDTEMDRIKALGEAVLLTDRESLKAREELYAVPYLHDG